MDDPVRYALVVLIPQLCDQLIVQKTERAASVDNRRFHGRHYLH